ncbi:MAG: RIP metalloprotease RseP [Candidatus Kerfeldbacteria bacterium]|nr:RIP metalloprotease RseP [Candidatus Kerfeldbacteria bacterium]
MNPLITILLFILVLGILVLVHEIGHFLLARIFRVGVEEFGIGFPPRVWSKKIGPTVYSINAIPVGGFVRVKGVAGDERLEEQESHDADSFAAQPFWKRFLILFAGIAMNIFLAAVFFIITFWIGIRSVVPDTYTGTDAQLSVTYVEKNGPADVAGVEIHDVILSVDAQEVRAIDDFRSYIQSHTDTVVTVRVERDGEQRDLSVTPAEVSVHGETVTGVGVGLVSTAIVHDSFIQGIVDGLRTTWNALLAIVIGFWDLLRHLVLRDQPVADQLSGPVGIAVLTHEFAQEGVSQLLQFAAILSLNLAIFNLLPFPMLDGGRIFFLCVELVRRKPVSHQFEARVHQIGFLLLFGLLIFVTIKDVAKIF